MRFPLLLCSCLLLQVALLQAQKHLEGPWEGVLIDQGREYKVELQLRKEGRRLTAQTYLYLSDTTVIAMEANGIWHDDRSLNLYENNWLPSEAGQAEPPLSRTYQLLYRRSFGDFFLEGWWQEQGKRYNDPQRRLGRIYLKPVLPTKA